MPKKKFRDTPSKQSARFVATAKRLGYDESGDSFARAFEKIVPKRKRKKIHGKTKRESQ